MVVVHLHSLLLPLPLGRPAEGAHSPLTDRHLGVTRMTVGRTRWGLEQTFLNVKGKQTQTGVTKSCYFIAPRSWQHLGLLGSGAKEQGMGAQPSTLTQVTAGCGRPEEAGGEDTGHQERRPLHTKHKVKLTQTLSQPSDRYYKALVIYIYLCMYTSPRIWTDFLGPSFPFPVWLMIP